MLFFVQLVNAMSIYSNDRATPLYGFGTNSATAGLSSCARAPKEFCMTKVLASFMCLGLLFMTSAPWAICSEEKELHIDDIPMREEQTTYVNKEQLTPDVPSDHEQSRDLKKYTPPSFARKVAQGTLIGPVKWVTGMPVVVTYIAKTQTKHGTQNWTRDKKHAKLWAVPAFIGHLSGGIVNGMAMAPVFAGEHAWGNRPLCKEEL
jgi:hypothetical protein